MYHRVRCLLPLIPSNETPRKSPVIQRGVQAVVKSAVSLAASYTGAQQRRIGGCLFIAGRGWQFFSDCEPPLARRRLRRPHRDPSAGVWPVTVLGSETLANPSHAPVGM